MHIGRRDHRSWRAASRTADGSRARASPLRAGRAPPGTSGEGCPAKYCELCAGPVRVRARPATSCALSSARERSRRSLPYEDSRGYLHPVRRACESLVVPSSPRAIRKSRAPVAARPRARRPANVRGRYAAVSLFAGAGGLDLGRGINGARSRSVGQRQRALGVRDLPPKSRPAHG